MNPNPIKINDVSLKQITGVPMVFHGKHSGKDLSGINLDFHVQGQELIQKIEALFEQESVSVIDPFTNRSYIASFRMLSSSYIEGEPGHHYTAEIREIDMPPEFEILEIEGHQFHIIKYIESDEHENGFEDAIAMHALLRLSREEFDTLNKLIKKNAASIKRIGVDEESFKVRFGGAMYWSQHKDEGEIYFKKIIRLYPPDLPSGKLSFLRQLDINAGILFAFAVRFEALLDLMLKNGVISKENKDDLLTKEIKDLMDEERLDELALKFDNVSDAVEEFD